MTAPPINFGNPAYFSPLRLQNQLGTERLERVRQLLREESLQDTYFMATVVCGYTLLRPETHGPLCTFLDTCNVKRRLIQMPRSHFKTVITTVVHKLQAALKDPTVRILIVGDTGPNAIKHLGKIENQLTNNKLLRWIFKERMWEDVAKAPAWNKEQLYLPINSEGHVAYHGEPTFDAIGAGGAAVSRHYNIINADDLIGESDFYSEADMSKKIDWFSNIEALFVPPVEEGLLDIPSTFWRTDDIYAYAEDFFGRGESPVRTGPYSYQRGDIAVFRRGAIEDGEAIFPAERNAKGKIVNGFSVKFFERIREKNPERYAAQYANNPRSAENTYFQQSYIRYYTVRDEEGRILSVERPGGIVELVHVEQLHIVSMCDPHAGGTNKFRGSRAAVLTTGVDVRYPRIYILDCWIKRAATNFIVDEIFRQNKKWQPERFSIEANGLQKMLKYWIDERTERDPDECPEVPYYPYIPKGGKDDAPRIKGLQPLFRAGQIYGQHGFNELWEEYSAYPRGLKDGLDALSQGLDPQMWGLGLDVSDEDMDEQEENMRRNTSVATGY